MSSSGPVGKRLFDIVFASAILLMTWPLIVVAGLAVKLTSAGPAFYRARRAGRDGRLFLMLKIRTMRVGADTPERKITAEGDSRITRVGQWLRRFELDELPQFWNIIRGDMSVVGPRPEDYDIVQQYYTPEQRRTLLARPGLVSPSAVRWYPDMAFHDPPDPGVSMQDWYLARHLPVQLADAAEYVEHCSLALDMKVIIRTAYCVLVYSWIPPAKRPFPLERPRNLHDQLLESTPSHPAG
jgi:lipopolysaccharide/colanic/teichoic acid biosynthesis glycosyltransferase